MKKFSLLLTVFALVLVFLLPVNAEAATVASGQCGDNATWVLDSNGAFTVSGTGEMYEIGGYPVWTSYIPQIKKVVIQEGITNVGACSFLECSAITEVSLPDSVTYIDYDAFAGCTGLTAIQFPESLETVSVGAFSGCSGLKSVTFPASLKELHWEAFYNHQQ